MCFCEFCKQFAVLAWKNNKLKWRNWSVLLIELLIPTIIMFGLRAILFAIKPDFVAESIPTSPKFSFEFKDLAVNYNIPCNAGNLIWSCLKPDKCWKDAQNQIDPSAGCTRRKIAVAPSAASKADAVSAAQSFYYWVSSHPDYYIENITAFELFSSEDEIISRVKNPSYTIDTNLTLISAAIIFNSGHPSWGYTVRLNQTLYEDVLMTKTSDKATNNQIKSNKDADEDTWLTYVESYIASNYFTLTDTVNSFIATSTCQASGSCDNDEYVKLRASGIAYFPSAEVKVNIFWKAIGDTFALLLIIALFYPLFNIISTLVAEKESKLRESMMMMSLRSDALWCSWLFHFIALFFPLSIILTLVGKSLFEYSDSVLVFLYFFLFFLGSTSYCIFMSNFFNKARTAAIVGCLVFFAGYFIYVGLKTSSTGRSGKLLAMLHPATAFTYGTLAFQEYEDANIGVTQYTYNKSSRFDITFSDCLVMMFVDFIYLGVLSCYFSQIWPSEFGTHKPWYFPFLPSYWISCLSYLNSKPSRKHIPLPVKKLRSSSSLEKLGSSSSYDALSAEDEKVKAIEMASVKKEKKVSYAPLEEDEPEIAPDNSTTWYGGLLDQLGFTDTQADKKKRYASKSTEAQEMREEAQSRLSYEDKPDEDDGGDEWNFPKSSTLRDFVQQNEQLYKPTKPKFLVHTEKKEAEAEEARSRVEPVPESLASQQYRNECVVIENLYKAFDTNTGKKVAVDNLNLSLYSGQITALLGHNGAGKSTTIAMLTGLISPDKGTAVIEGMDITESMQDIRRCLGVCPQHDILIPDLTVQEHLIMFASFKGTPSAKINEEVEKMIQSVGLVEKRHVYAKELSGGQKRKLSVGIAFIGNSRVIFLDEPTSGMDPYSRRFTWNVIRKHREGRIIVLTTHFMDEADLLGDRIAIMGDGKLQCCGSSLFLKKLFGVGYSLTIEKIDATNFDSNALKGLIASFVPEAKLLTDVGTELTMQLPLSASSTFAKLFAILDKDLAKWGVRSYGISVTTLEEVFLKVAHGTENNATAVKGRNGEVATSSTDTDQPSEELLEGGDLSANRQGKALPSSEPFERIRDEAVLQLFFRHVYAMLLKRVMYFQRDSRSWVYQYFIPVVFVLAGMLIMSYTSYITVQPPLKLRREMYNGGITSNRLPLPYSSASKACNFSVYSGWTTPSYPGYQPCQNISGQSTIMGNVPDSGFFPLLPRSDVESVYEMSKELFEHRNDYRASVYGAVSFAEVRFNESHISYVDYVVHSNYTARHASPFYSSLAAEAITRTYDSSATISTILHPFPLTYKEQMTLESYNANLVVTFILLAVPFIPAAFASFVVREREVRSKPLQMISGVSIPAYWLSTFIWDNVSYQPTVWMLVLLVVAFPDSDTLTTKVPLGCLMGLLTLYGSAISGFSYLISFSFTSSSSAQICIIFIVLISGLILCIVGIVLRILVTDPYMNGIRHAFALFPPFALGDALQNIILLEIWSAAELGGAEKYKILDWEITGLNFAFLAWESVVYILLTVLFEYYTNSPSLRALCASERLPELERDPSLDKDEDVLAEEERIMSGEADDSSVILVKGLKKVYYPGGKYAVKGVSLSIPNGECFGLLGINGAGKSSTLGMLSGDFPPTQGEISLAGMNLLTEVNKCRKKIGFCPQFDALFELLTGREHLVLYARIKGIQEKDIERVVDAKIAEMALTEYADRAAGTYSGGNKRKLSVAIAMIGEPSIVFLDEPSTGMDPVARRFMWEVITDIVTRRGACSVILTTHSMEECEALCTRIGIMVGGVLRCLGSGQHLRSRYGSGYQMEIGFTIPSETELANCERRIYLATGLAQDTYYEGDDYLLSPVQLGQALFTLGKADVWATRMHELGFGAEVVALKYLASWWILEEIFDRLCVFLDEAARRKYFISYTIRERQTTKVRVELKASKEDASNASLAELFQLIEGNKKRLKLQEYSISQTSLEQIFNGFASKQEEESGASLQNNIYAAKPVISIPIAGPTSTSEAEPEPEPALEPEPVKNKNLVVSLNPDALNFELRKAGKSVK